MQPISSLAKNSSEFMSNRSTRKCSFSVAWSELTIVSATIMCTRPTEKSPSIMLFARGE